MRYECTNCYTEVDAEDAIIITHPRDDGQKRAFCSPECRDEWLDVEMEEYEHDYHIIPPH